MATSDLERKQEFTKEYGEQKPRAMCTCRHTGDGKNSQHANVRMGGAGHGYCKAVGCKCRQFRWSSWTPSFIKGLDS